MPNTSSCLIIATLLSPYYRLKGEKNQQASPKDEQGLLWAEEEIDRIDDASILCRNIFTASNANGISAIQESKSNDYLTHIEILKKGVTPNHENHFPPEVAYLIHAINHQENA